MRSTHCRRWEREQEQEREREQEREQGQGRKRGRKYGQGLGQSQLHRRGRTTCRSSGCGRRAVERRALTTSQLISGTEGPRPGVTVELDFDVSIRMLYSTNWCNQLALGS